jgi:hypothetical protein
MCPHMLSRTRKTPVFQLHDVNAFTTEGWACLYRHYLRKLRHVPRRCCVYEVDEELPTDNDSPGSIHCPESISCRFGLTFPRPGCKLRDFWCQVVLPHITHQHYRQLIIRPLVMLVAQFTVFSLTGLISSPRDTNGHISAYQLHF